ncbi:MAG: 50S ribosomal protein L11 methyltransferase [Alphaproteobacteria bacterium]|nr:50S ribosomal protein L11 methyltransferase [Alphaproteobacteria bacterium]
MTEETNNNWQLDLVLSQQAMPFFEKALDGDEDTALLAQLIEKGTNKGKWLLQAIFQEKPDKAALETKLEIATTLAKIDFPKYTLSEIVQKDWLRASLDSFKPVSVGNYYIYGSHIKDLPPQDKISLQIDAATAFGSGEHFTTQGCLLGLEEVSSKIHIDKILDMGCGSGILGLAAAATLHKNVVCADIDPESVRVTLENAQKNNLEKFITAYDGNGYARPEIKENGPYNLIFSNILARPLTMMAKDLSANLSEHGVAILSGLLYKQENWVISAHKRAGLKLKKRYRIEGWSTLIMGKDEGDL